MLAREEHHVLGGKRCKMRIKVRVHFTLAPRALTNPTGSIEALFPGALVGDGIPLNHIITSGSAVLRKLGAHAVESLSKLFTAHT